MPNNTPERIELAAGLDASRIVTGLWQLADMERGGVLLDPVKSAAELASYAAEGFDTFGLCAGCLHDAIEDVGATGEEIGHRFGPRARALVEAVSDDKSLPQEERKKFQIQHAPDKSPDAKLIALADKIANLQDLSSSPPADWSADRVKDYFDWAHAVFLGLRGGGTLAHARLETAFLQALGRRP